MIVVLHGATMTGPQMAKLTGVFTGHTTAYPNAKYGKRWDHLGNTDVPTLRALGGDYIVGFSSGAFMAMRMVQERQYKAAAIISGGVITPYLSRLNYPCPILLCHGTADKIVPYEGVPYAYESGLDAALALRALLNAPLPATALTENNVNDGCRAVTDSWGDSVRLTTIVNGGHTWPGPVLQPGYGRVCRDINLTTEIVEFFRRHP